MTIDIREVAHCMCLALRRAARQVTQIYDRQLEAAGLTVNQFGLLAHLHAAHTGSGEALSIGTLAERIGMDPTTLNRSLKPLQALKLVATATDPRDRRVRALALTRKGRAKLEQAMPLWRAARAETEAAIGGETAAAIRGLLDLSSARISKRG
jgi:DNA-binding MarR family transcriptional regulator